MDITIRRILVALDMSPHSLAALEAAVRLAAGLDAEVTGLFVEDDVLLRSADLPLTRESSQFSRAPRQLDSRQIEREFRVQARRLERHLRQSAEQVRVHWSFRIVRGTVATEVLGAAADSDLITLGKIGRSPRSSKRLGSTVRAIVTEARRPALIMRKGLELEHPVVVLYDGSPSAQTALTIAAQLAQIDEQQLIVLIPRETQSDAGRLQAQAVGWVTSQGITATYRHIAGRRPATICHAVQQADGGVLVVPHDAQSMDADALEALLNEIDCPVLLV